MRPSRKNVHSIEPAQSRPSHEQLAAELADWQAQGGRIKQLPLTEHQPAQKITNRERNRSVLRGESQAPCKPLQSPFGGLKNA